MLTALRDDNEFDLTRLRGLLKVATLMTISILRTADAWWVEHRRRRRQDRHRPRRPPASCWPTGRRSTRAAHEHRDRRPSTASSCSSPVTAPCRVVAQMTNFASHVKDAGMDPKTIPLTFFRKASGSISGPFDDIVKPEHVRLLDYEVEIGLVIGRDIPVGTTITEDNLADYVAGLVVTNDVSARDVQLPKTQFYESKSYPTFTPVGPALVLLDADELKRFGDLRLRLRVNGELRQDMHGRRRHDLSAGRRRCRRWPGSSGSTAGDLVLTGTPVGTALSAPPKPVQKSSASCCRRRRQVEAVLQAARPRTPSTCSDGDVVEAQHRHRRRRDRPRHAAQPRSGTHERRSRLRPGGDRRRRADRDHRGDTACAVRRRLPGPRPLGGRLPAAACRSSGRRDLPVPGRTGHRRRVRRDLPTRAGSAAAGPEHAGAGASFTGSAPKAPTAFRRRTCSTSRSSRRCCGRT